MEANLEDFADKAVQHAMNLGCKYCDIRAEKILKQGLVIENGEVEHFTTIDDSGLGIRVLNSGAWGFFSISNPATFEEVARGIKEAAKAAQNTSTKKRNKVELGNVRSNIDKVNFPIGQEPTLDELLKIGFECDKTILEKKRVIKSHVNAGFSKVCKYFVNSEGSKITQSFTDVVAELVATSFESGLAQSVSITEGGRGGMEKLSNKHRHIVETASFISEKASQLIDATTVKDEKTTLIMNPDFVALLTHEILGHPSEADRVLGKEMAWAGGAWWAGKIGKRVGSEQLNVFDDPTIEGTMGWYKFDDEGTIASKTNLIGNGVLTSHLQSRETAEIFETNPTANMRATSYKFMPLIRMACTCIGKGDWQPDEMIKETKNGYLISNMKVPSIDMKRYNWSISCQFAQKIENGQLTQLVRDVIVLGNAPEFFKSIDACGRDFTVRPITNCGKGDPMQSMSMGNGGPSIRGVATVRSA